MKIYTLADLASNWYPHQAINQFQRYSCVKFVSHPDQADLIWIMSYYLTPASLLALPPVIYKLLPLPVRRKKTLARKPVITTIHHLTPAKKSLWQQNIRLLDMVTDYWQTFSQINIPYFEKFMTKPIHVLPYWIDSKQFFPLSPQRRIQTKDQYKLPRHKTIIGSFQRDTESDLVSPKLEKGPDIFCDIVEQLDRNSIFVLLAGPRRDYIQKKLAASNIPHRSLGKVSFSELNNLYNALDYYLVTSRCEGGPQAILEAMATRTKIYSTRVGVADLLSPPVIFSDPQQCAAMLDNEYPNVLDEHYKKISSLSCQQVIPKFEQLFSQLIKDYERTHSIPV